MKMKSKLAVLTVGALLGVTVQGCSPDASSPVLLPATDISAAGGTTGVTLKAAKSAITSLTEQVTYDWEITKTVTPALANLSPGESTTFSFQVSATRTAASSSLAYGMTGLVCAQNTGTEGTEGLLITDRVFALLNGVFTEVGSFVVDTSENPELEVGETHCYPYDLAMAPGFTPNPSAEYRNVAYLHTTVIGDEGIPYSLRLAQPTVTFTWPDSPTATEAVDASATVADVLDCPIGFTCTPTESGWTVEGTSSRSLPVLVTNVNAVCGGEFQVRNRASLVENDSEVVRGPVTATGIVTTPGCTPPASIHGCTPGYWKQPHHFDSWVGYSPGQDYDAVFGVNAFTPNRTLLQALSSGGGKMNRLGRHSAAALLSSSNGDVQYGMTTAEVIALVKQAVATGNFDLAADKLEKLNERGCPLN